MLVSSGSFHQQNVKTESLRTGGNKRLAWPLVWALILVLCGALLLSWAWSSEQDDVASYLIYAVEGQPLEASQLLSLVLGVGGEVTHELGLIDAVAADLDRQGARQLRERAGLAVLPNRTVTTAGGGAPVSGSGPSGVYQMIRADEVHATGTDGFGVTVAVLDTGTWNESGRFSVLGSYDAVLDAEPLQKQDEHGHGTFVSSLIASDQAGVAPGADLVIVKAFGREGQGQYADIIRGIDWVVENRHRFGIRVLNLSFSAPVRSFYWEDPLAMAAMRAWEAGIVVVAATGNRGGSPMSIGVPGNVPYLITVGGASDASTADDASDDYVSAFSSAGPTLEGFAKPDLVAPAGAVSGIVHPSARLVADHPEAFSGRWFTLSGTSAASAITSGAAALVLSEFPELNPDEVKCRLLSSSRPALDANGELAYSIFQQGAGLLDVAAAAQSQASQCANSMLNVNMDLAMKDHYLGYANFSPEEGYHLDNQAGFEWDGVQVRAESLVWSEIQPWIEPPSNDAYPWNDRPARWDDIYVWSSAYPWNDGAEWIDGQLVPGDTENAYPWSDVLGEPVGLLDWIDTQ